MKPDEFVSSTNVPRCFRQIGSALATVTLFACAGDQQGAQGPVGQAAGPQQPPNFVIILADDLRADFLGYSGHPVIQTPNIDRMAESGVVFRNAFATSPICTPSRTSLLTGTYERNHTVNFGSGTVLSVDSFSHTYPALLRSAGYHVSYIGKNHTPMGESDNGPGYSSGLFENAFDSWFGNHLHSRFYPKDNHPIYSVAAADTQIEIFGEGAQAVLSPASSGSPVEALIGERPSDTPFAILINFNLPHGAGTSSMEQRPSDDALYRSAYRERIDVFPLPRTYLASDDIETPKIPTSVYNGEFISSYDYVRTPDALREQMVRIAQTVTGMDRMVGDLLATLETTGALDNTIIVFTSDHGIQLGEHGLGGKALLYEQSIHIPLLFMIPQHLRDAQNDTVDELVALIDIAPTLLDYADIEIPETMQGESLRRLIDEPNQPWREHLFLENLYTGQNYPRIEAVRGERYKYIRYFDNVHDGRYEASRHASLEGELPVYEEFYDLEIDPLEQINLIMSPQHSELIESYREINTELLQEAFQ